MATKSFKGQLDEPAVMNFISKPAQGTAPRKGKELPEGTIPDKRYVETKSKRLQVLMQPSIFAKLKARAEAEGLSVNEMLNSILISALEE